MKITLKAELFKDRLGDDYLKSEDIYIYINSNLQISLSENFDKYIQIDDGDLKIIKKIMNLL